MTVTSSNNSNHAVTSTNQKPPQILILEPASDITFVGPFDHTVTSYLELTNPTDERVCFKVKTTAPRRYCVRPNSSFVEPNGKVKITIMLQPMEDENPAERSRHKFMVQSTIVENDVNNIDKVWKEVQSEKIMDSKLRCVFQMPVQQQQQQQQQHGTSSTQAAPSTTTSTKSNAPSSTGTIQVSDSKAPSAPPIKDASPSKSTIDSKAQQKSPEKTIYGSSSGQKIIYGSSTGQKPIYGSSSGTRLFDKSTSSAQDHTVSFLQPMGDDYKLVLVSLVMLIAGVILGKYII